MPLVSILLPTHNRSDVLKIAIQSALLQTVQDFEVLVVGDGCTDDSAQVTAGFGDDRIRWFGLPKAPGFGYANRNLALKEATGRYVAFLAHDDVWLPDHLEVMASLLERPGTELACSRPIWVHPDGTAIPIAGSLHSPDVFFEFMSRERNLFPAGCFAHSRESLEKYGYWNEDMLQDGDWDLWARIIEGGSGKNFAVTRLPTNLHFRAIWRTDANAGPVELTAWHRLFEAGSLPSSLSIPHRAGELEQEAYITAIKADPGGWTREFRAAVDSAVDEMAHYAERNSPAFQTVEQHQALLASTAAQEAELADLRTALAQKQALLDEAAVGLAESRERADSATRELQSALESLAQLEDKNRALSADLEASHRARGEAIRALELERGSLGNIILRRSRAAIRRVLPEGTRRGRGYDSLLARITKWLGRP